MYTGSLIIDAFGRDTSVSPIPFIGIPLTGNCNQLPFHAKETFVIQLPNTITPTTTFTVTIPDYGGNVAQVDTNGDGVFDVPFGCEAATIQAGDPLLGSGPVDTSGATGVACSPTCTNPRKITIPPWALRMQKSGASMREYGVYLWDVHFADLHNDVGVFSKGGGDGAFFVGHGTPNATRKAVQTAGKNKFGGVMRLLGSYGENEGYVYNVTTVSYQNWLFHNLGRGGQFTALGVVTAGYASSIVNYYYTVPAGFRGTGPTVHAEVFKWTTGTVTVTAVGGIVPTLLQRKGYDHRTPMGSGAVQLVSPMLTRWTGGITLRGSTAAIGVMKLNFAPEPSQWMLLSSGISMLGLMAWRRSRRR